MKYVMINMNNLIFSCKKNNPESLLKSGFQIYYVSVAKDSQ